VAKVTGVFPHRSRSPFLRCTMSDGATTHCCDEHLWLTKTQRRSRCWARLEDVRSLKEIRETLYLHKQAWAQRQESFNPYDRSCSTQASKTFLCTHTVLGVILGDGCTVLATAARLLFLTIQRCKEKVAQLLARWSRYIALGWNGHCFSYKTYGMGCPKQNRRRNSRHLEEGS
jgi:hypothetical protein